MQIDRIKLITAMAEKRLTARSISDSTGVSLSTISAVKNGKSCSTIVGNAIAQALNVNVTDLLED